MMRGSLETLEKGFISHFTLVSDGKRVTARSGLSFCGLCWVVSEMALVCVCAPGSGSVFIFMLPHPCFCGCFQSSSVLQCLPLHFLMDLALQLAGNKGHLPRATASSSPSAHFQGHSTSTRQAFKGAGYPRPRSWLLCSRWGQSEHKYFLKAAPAP